MSFSSSYVFVYKRFYFYCPVNPLKIGEKVYLKQCWQNMDEMDRSIKHKHFKNTFLDHQATGDIVA